VTWINIDGLHEVDVIEKMGKNFGLHPLVLEDIVHTEQRPKMEEFESYIFLVTKMLSYDEAENELKAEQFSLILGPNYIITFQERVGDVFEMVRERLRKGKGRIRKRPPDYLAYALIDAVTHPVTLGVTLGLIVGKPLGIFLFTYLATKTLKAPLPFGVKWIHILGAGTLGGIGFTMSLFISGLSFVRGEFTELSKLGIIMGSLVSGGLGLVVLSLSKAPSSQAPNTSHVRQVLTTSAPYPEQTGQKKFSQAPVLPHFGQGSMTGTVIGKRPPSTASPGESIASK
jgi:hypothetical protein